MGSSSRYSRKCSNIRYIGDSRAASYVNSMSDLFHVDVPLAYIKRVFQVMTRAHWHEYQVLTKRSDRLRDLNSDLKWQPQIWMGVSIENEDYIFRADDLRKTGAHVKFLSIEPLLGPLHKLKLKGIDWAIVGGESGPGARPIDPDWIRGASRPVRTGGSPSFLNNGVGS